MSESNAKNSGHGHSAGVSLRRDAFGFDDIVLEKLIHRGRKAEIYSARLRDGSPVIVKRLCPGEQTSENIAQLRHEYEILCELDGAGVRPALGFTEIGGFTALVLVDVHGINLHDFLRARPSFLRLLRVVERWARALAELHVRGIIHRDVNPANVLVSLDDERVHVIDFGIARRLSQSQSSLPFEPGFVGTLNYIAPEQTGRIQVGLDERCDIYAFGASIYEVFTGRPPFLATEALELIHSHLAKTPQKPVDLDPQIPDCLSRMMIRLLAKNPNDRYRGILGVAEDLAEIRVLYERENHEGLAGFIPGQRDLPLRLTVTEQLYGREVQLAELERIWDKVVSGASATLMIQGVSGSGKTSLINRLGFRFWHGKAFVGGGKHELFSRDLPYSGIAQVASQLIKNIQADDDHVYRRWLERLNSGLVQGAALIIDFIPELANIVGVGERPTQLSPNESKHLIQAAFLSFLAACADIGKPLVIFLDDLQWADTSSLELISLWVRGSYQHTLFIGAYRQEDLENSPVLQIFLNEWEQRGVGYTHLTVGPIDEEAILKWCCDLLYWEPERAKPLAALVHQRTHGNPLFVKQLLQKLYRDGLLYVSIEKLCWCADFSSIQLTAVSDHIITHVLTRLRELPTSLQRILACASFVGTQFYLKTVASVLKISEQDVAEQLAIAVSEELIFRVGKASEAAESKFDEACYRFLHDRFIEASQTLLADYEALEMRLALGRYILGFRESFSDLSPGLWPVMSQAIFHYIESRSLLIDPSEKRRIAQLACEAGERAQSAAAWKIGADLFKGGREILGEIDALACRDLIRSLKIGEGSCAMLAGQAKDAQGLFDQLLAESRNEPEIAEIQSLRCRLYTSIEMYTEAVAAGISGLRVLGEWRGTAKIGVARGAWEVYKCQRRLVKIGRDKLMALKPTVDYRQRLITRINAETAHPAMLVQPYLAMLMARKQIEYAVRYGHSPNSVLAFLSIVMSINGAFAVSGIKIWTKRSPDLLLDIYDALERQQIADAPQIERRLVYHAFASHWRDDFRDSSRALMELVPRLIDIGKISYVGVAMLISLDLGMVCGQNVINLASIIAGWNEYIEQRLEKRDRRNVKEFQAVVAKIVGSDVQDVLGLLSSLEIGSPAQEFDLAYISGLYTRRGVFYSIFRNHSEALKSLISALRFGIAKRQAGNYKIPVIFFFLAIACMETFDGKKWWQKAWRRLAIEIARYFIAGYAEMNPLFSQHKLMFVDALRLMLKKKHLVEASRKIESAIELAHKFKFSLDEACMAEFLGRFWLKAGNQRLALGALVSARDAFERCGFLAKVREIKTLIADFQFASVVQDNRQFERMSTTENGQVEAASLLDLPTLTRASGAIAREIKLEDLKMTLLKLLVENAGARCAALLWRNKGEESTRGPMKIVAYRSTDGLCSSEETMPHNDLVSLRVLAFVERSRSKLIVSGIDQDVVWHRDTALRARKAKSLLCMPIFVAGEQNGAIYLENDLLDNAFSPDRVEILNVLCGQIAISLDNAVLYGQLNEALIAEKTARAEEQAAYQAFARAEAARSKLQAGIEAAEAVQKSLVDVRQMSESYRVAYLYNPAENTGGDWLTTYYDHTRSWLYLCLGDVTGHGVPAALITAAVAGAAASAVARISCGNYDLPSALEEIIIGMDAAVKATRDATSQLMTMVLVGVDLRTGDACYVNAGHHPILRLGTEQAVILEGGNPLGYPGPINHGKRQFRLGVGDTLVLYSDGLVENISTAGERLKLASLRRISRKHNDPQALIEALKGYVDEFALGSDRDDTACLVFQWLGHEYLAKVV